MMREWCKCPARGNVKPKVNRPKRHETKQLNQLAVGFTHLIVYPHVDDLKIKRILRKFAYTHRAEQRKRTNIMADPVSDTNKNFRDLYNLEKSLDLKVFLLMFNFVIFADAILALGRNHGICELASGKTDLGSNFAFQLVIIFIVFSFFVSVVMPILSELTLFFMLSAVYKAQDVARGIWRAMQTDDQIRRKEREQESTWNHRAKTVNSLSSGFVRLNDIKKKAETSKEDEEYYLP